MKMEPAECIYLQRLDGEKDEIIVRREQIAGMTLLNILQFVKEKGEEQRRKGVVLYNRNDKRLSKVLKKYYCRDIAVMANERVLKELNLGNILFEARKQEFIHNMQGILSSLRQCSKMQTTRSCCMLVLDSLAWRQNEIVDIIKAIKNCYEDIYIVIKKTVVNIEEITSFFFEEYGVMLYRLSDYDGKQQKTEATFLFVEEWNEGVREYVYTKGYVVAEWEKNMIRIEKGMKEGRELYSGFLYQYNNCEVPYEIAVMLLYSPLVKSRMIHRTYDFSISIVANCLVE